MCECPRPMDSTKQFKHCSDCPELHKKQHKWHKEIKAWADGAKIQWLDTSTVYIWKDCPNPIWNTDDTIEYRIKPESATIKGYIIIRKSGFCSTLFTSPKVAIAWAKSYNDFIKIMKITETIEV